MEQISNPELIEIAVQGWLKEGIGSPVKIAGFLKSINQNAIALLLKIRNIHKSFGEQKVLNGISFEMEKGKVYTLVGGNGSGKTTLFNLITGFLRPDFGTIEFKGKVLNHLSPVGINRLGIARTFQDLRIIKNITVRENILLALNRNQRGILSEFKNFGRNDYLKADEILKEVSLTKEMDSLADEISYGQQKLLTLGCCLANDSEVLLLDEPVAGIDKENYKKIRSLVDKISKELKRYILQVEHNLEFIKESSDCILFLNDGKNSVFMNYSDFLKDSIVKTSYFKEC